MADDDSEAKEAAPSVDPSDDRAALRKRAETFLKDANVKEAPRNEKRVFLRSKGLSEAEIDDFLTSRETADTLREKQNEEPKSQKDVKALAEGPVSQDFHSSGPPIITYPEFLQHSERPQPLITTSGLVASAYVVSGAAALLYGAGRYLVQPMVESLNAARQSLYENASKNLLGLNEKLEANVSVKPDMLLKQKDECEDELDPSSYFTRSTGTQTSDDLRSAPVKEAEKAPTRSEQEAARLAAVKKELADLSADKAPEEAIKASVEELRVFLRQLPRSPNPTSLSKHDSTWAESKNDDPISKVKAEIKGVKGVLLSARNFPSSVVR